MQLHGRETPQNVVTAATVSEAELDAFLAPDGPWDTLVKASAKLTKTVGNSFFNPEDPSMRDIVQHTRVRLGMLPHHPKLSLKESMQLLTGHFSLNAELANDVIPTVQYYVCPTTQMPFPLNERLNSLVEAFDSQSQFVLQEDPPRHREKKYEALKRCGTIVERFIARNNAVIPQDERVQLITELAYYRYALDEVLQFVDRVRNSPAIQHTGQVSAPPMPDFEHSRH